MQRDSFHSMRGSTRSPSSSSNPTLLLALTLAMLPAPGSTASFTLQPGSYDITAQMVMPHLEEMRRIVTQEQRCLGDDNPVALFPVLRQPALRGCALDYGVQDADTFQYVLVCETARVATGTARLNRSGDRIVGTLDVKMGGKNMTFSQRIEAVLRGGCGVPE